MNAEQHWELISTLIPDPQAVEFLRFMNLAVNVWDDLIDGDNPKLRPSDVHRAFEAMLVHIPRNAFYQRWRAELQPVIEVAIAEWRASVDMQAGDREQVVRAHTLRFSGLSVWVLCARLTGGQDAATRAALALRKAIPSETLEDFISEVTT